MKQGIDKCWSNVLKPNDSATLEGQCDQISTHAIRKALRLDLVTYCIGDDSVIHF